MFERLDFRRAGFIGGQALLLAVIVAVPSRAQTSSVSSNATDRRIARSASIQPDPELRAIESEIASDSYAKAESDIRAYLQRHPRSSAGHALFGYILYREDKPKESLAEYTLGARFHTPDANDLAVVAMDYILLADYADADKWLTKATQWEPGNALYWYHLGRTKYNENRFQEAVAAFQRALSLHPRDVKSEYNLGLSFDGLGRSDDAAAAYKTAIHWEDTSAHKDPQPYLDLGLLLARRGNITQATEYLAQAAKLDPDNPKAHEALGRNYEQRKELSKAEAEYKSAIALAPDISALHFELGRVYRKEHRDELAKAEFARCAALDQTHSSDSSNTPNIGLHKQ